MNNQTGASFCSSPAFQVSPVSLFFSDDCFYQQKRDAPGRAWIQLTELDGWLARVLGYRSMTWTHRIHGYGMFTYIYFISMVNVYMKMPVPWILWDWIALPKQPTRIHPFILVELRWLTCYFHWINLGSLSGIQELLVDLLRLTPIFTVCQLYLLRINISALPTENQPKINPFGASDPWVGSQTFTDWHHLTTSSGIQVTQVLRMKYHGFCDKLSMYTLY